MTTSGLSTFNLDLTDLVEEAYERCGQELRSGYDLRTARRSINLMTVEWANRGINLWTIEQGQIPMVTGQAIYALPNDTIDLLDTVVRTSTYTTSKSSGIHLTCRQSVGVRLAANRISHANSTTFHCVWLSIDAGIANLFAHHFCAEFSHVIYLSFGSLHEPNYDHIFSYLTM